MATNLKEPYRHYYTLEEYFALENVGDRRYEYWDGEIVCMSGGTKQHALITSYIHRELSARLKGSKCRAFTEGTPLNAFLAALSVPRCQRRLRRNAISIFRWH